MKMPAIKQERPPHALQATGWVAIKYLEFQSLFVDFFVEHLSDLSRVFPADLQQMLLLAAVGQVKIRAVRNALIAARLRSWPR